MKSILIKCIFVASILLVNTQGLSYPMLPKICDILRNGTILQNELLQAVNDPASIQWLQNRSIDVSLVNSILRSSNKDVLIKEMSKVSPCPSFNISEVIYAVDWEDVIKAINFDMVIEDNNASQALTRILGVDVSLLKIVGLNNIARSIEMKPFINYYVNDVIGKKEKFNVNLLLKTSINWGELMKRFMRAKSTLNITKDCGNAFENMLLPIPDFSNVDFSKEETITTLFQHPFLQLLDSWDKLPSRILLGKRDLFGAVDQCSEIANTKYCLANMDVANDLITGSYGFCMPKLCTENDGKEILEYLAENALGGMVKFPKRLWQKNRPNPVNCKKHLPFLEGFYNTLWIVGIIIVLVVLGTIIDEFYCYQEKLNQSAKKEDKQRERILLVKILICFSLTRNAKFILSTKVPKGAIQSINGIRTISITWIIVGHTFAIMKWTPADNIKYLMGMIRKPMTLAVLNSYPSVDSFFVLSGCLLSYLTLKKMDKTGGQLNLLMFYLHRFIRVTPVLMFIILVRVNLITAINERSTMGLLRDESGTRESCQRYWWTNFLYINNFYPKSFWVSCTSITWYLANDMQFYIVSPVFLYSIYYLEKWLGRRKSPLKYWCAAIVLSLGCLVCVLINIGLVYHNNYSTVHAAFQMMFKGNPRGKPRMDPQDEIYDKPYTRISPYLVGMLLGYLFARDLKMNFKRKQLFNVVFWILAIVSGYYIIYGPSDMYKENPIFMTDAENISFGSLHMLAWGICVAWVIYSCHYGMGGLVNDFLSWKAWIPLSRLTYCAYLLHSDVAAYFLYGAHNGYHIQITAFIFHFISIVTATFFISFIFSLLVEIPFMNLGRLLLTQAPRNDRKV